MLALSQCSWGAYFEFMPPLLKTQLHANPMHIGWFISLITVMLAITAFIISPYLTKKISPHQQQGIAIATLLAGCVCAASAGLLPAKPLTYNLFALSACLCACGDVLLYIMIVSDFATYAPKHCKGQMMGLDYLVVTLVWGGMGQLGGWILAHNPQKLLFLLPFGSLLLFIYWLFTRPEADTAYTAGA